MRVEVGERSPQAGFGAKASDRSADRRVGRQLARDFPDRRFVVSWFDGSQEGGEISLSFYQAQ
jgi:hypothetical protein